MIQFRLLLMASMVLASMGHLVGCSGNESNQGSPPPGESLQLLAEDHTGTYLVPFRCEWRDGEWYGVGKTTPLEAKVLGWRSYRY